MLNVKRFCVVVDSVISAGKVNDCLIFGWCSGADPGEVIWMNFHSSFSEPLLNHADAQTSNTSTRLWFYYIITKIHPPFQNPGSAPGVDRQNSGMWSLGWAVALKYSASGIKRLRRCYLRWLCLKKPIRDSGKLDLGHLALNYRPRSFVSIFFACLFYGKTSHLSVR